MGKTFTLFLGLGYPWVLKKTGEARAKNRGFAS